MSKYKFEFGVRTNKNGSDCTDVIDLVDDWNYDEEHLDLQTEDEIVTMLDADQRDFVWNNIDSWVKRVD